MDSGLPVNLEDLLHLRGFEENRVEFKESLNEATGPAIVETVCAFANDLLNLNGGYVIIGIAERDGHAVLPPVGVTDVDITQRKIFELLHRIQPAYQPRMYPERYQEKAVLVLFCPGGDNRPYQARSREREGGQYFVRLGNVTSKARDDILRQLLGQTAKIPFDDRSCLPANVLELSPHLVRQHLLAVGSALAEIAVDDRVLLRQLDLVRPINAHEAPRNVAVLFFHPEPERYFPGARIDLVRFADGVGGQVLLERTFRGPLPEQVRSCLNVLEGLSGTLVRKSRGQIHADNIYAYPADALREALVNAVYHRSYDGTREPTKVYMYPDRIEVISYPGPHPAITMEHLTRGTIPPGLPARNRRIGEFMKELRLAETRGTGIPKIRRTLAENGSPPPEFHFHPGEDSGYFSIVLPIQAEHALLEGRSLQTQGRSEEATWLWRRALWREPGHAALAAAVLGHLLRSNSLGEARELLAAYSAARPASAQPFILLARYLLGRDLLDDGRLSRPLNPVDPDKSREARDVLSRAPEPATLDERIDQAMLLRIAGDPQDAYRRLRLEFDRGQPDPRLYYHLGLTALVLAEGEAGEQKEQLLLEATDLFEQAIPLAPSKLERWSWLRMAQALAQLPVPRAQVERAYRQAMDVLMTEPAYLAEYRRWQGRGGEQ